MYSDEQAKTRGIEKETRDRDGGAEVAKQTTRKTMKIEREREGERGGEREKEREGEKRDIGS